MLMIVGSALLIGIVVLVRRDITLVQTTGAYYMMDNYIKYRLDRIADEDFRLKAFRHAAVLYVRMSLEMINQIIWHPLSAFRRVKNGVPLLDAIYIGYLSYPGN